MKEKFFAKRADNEIKVKINGTNEGRNWGMSPVRSKLKH